MFQLFQMFQLFHSVFRVLDDAIIQHIFQLNTVYTHGRYISFQIHETLKTCSYYKFLQQNPQPVYVN